MEKISHVIELNQLINSEKTYWIHSNTTSSEFVKSFKDFVSKHKNELKINKANQSKFLPPTTARIFEKFDPKIQTILLAGYNDQFTNQYYHSLFDDADNLDIEETIKELYSFSNLLASVIF